jgi:hypothetical protein
MPHQAETGVIPPRLEACSSAERMRRYRQRRRDGFCCLWVEIHVTEIDALTRMRFLKEQTRNDPNEIREALYAFLDQTLGAAQ